MRNRMRQAINYQKPSSVRPGGVTASGRPGGGTRTTTRSASVGRLSASVTSSRTMDS